MRIRHIVIVRLILAVVVIAAIMASPALVFAINAKRSAAALYVTRRYAIPQVRETAVVIGMRDRDRLIERLDGCKRDGWADFWLAVAGAGAAVGGGALLAALTPPPPMSAPVDVPWVLMGAGTAIFLLCMIGYLTQRRNHGSEIGELKKDLEILR
jgi:peptidoglycan/LPS O-acetylase OafA/YrhL